MDEVGYALKEKEDYLGCEVVYPELSTAAIIRKKSLTYETLAGSVLTPEVYVDERSIEEHLPVFAKPDIGYGSRGARKINSVEELREIAPRLDEYVVAEFLPGAEYTVDCFSNNAHEVLFAGARQRCRIRMGISVSTKTVQDNRIKDIAAAISQKLGMKGTWFFQLKENKQGELALLEVASRVSGSMALYRGLGVNFMALDLFQRQGVRVGVPVLSATEAGLERSFDCKIDMDLSYERVYCDLDDCLIKKDKINTSLLHFLGQCINKGVELILITRHAKQPEATLRAFRLDNFFDRIIHIQDREIPKSSHIEGKDAIFIDDSFQERLDVSDQHGIPVFAPDAIELLISDKA